METGEAENIFDTLSKIYGENISLMEECPKVYHISVKHSELELIPNEYFIVEAGSPVISLRAKRMGRPVEGQPELLEYLIDRPDSGSKVIQYEIYRYRLKNKLPLNAPESLYEFAIHCAEYHPDYFGAYPAPVITPHGYTVRYIALENGIHLIETDQGEDYISFSFPLWQTLSPFAQKQGKLSDHDLNRGVEGPAENFV